MSFSLSVWNDLHCATEDFFPRLRFYVAKLWSCVFSNEALTSLDRSENGGSAGVSRNPRWFGSVSDVVCGSPQWPVQSSFFGKAHKVPAGAEGHVLGAAMKLTTEKIQTHLLIPKHCHFAAKGPKYLQVLNFKSGQ